MVKVSDRKVKYRSKMERYLHEFKNILIVSVDNVGSNQLQQIRLSLRGRAEVLMGKNTIMRKVLRDSIDKNPKFEKLLPYVIGNIGFVFTNDDLSEIRKVIQDNKVPAAAKAGTLAPADVFVPAGPTGLDPGQTSFFQALNILTKIAKGAIEIINDVHLIKKGAKVGASEVALLNKINIKPFFYGVIVKSVYEDGSIYDADILDWSQDDILNMFLRSVQRLASLSLAIGYPTYASLPHILANSWRTLLAITVEIDYTFPQAQPIKDYLENPEAFAAAAAPAAAAAGAAEDKAEAAPAAKEDSEESDFAGGGGLFGDDDD